jgi:hypothetical protein
MGAVLEGMFIKPAALPGGSECFSHEPDFCEESGYGMLQVLGLAAAYAYMLAYGSGLISDGAELLQVVPSLEHLVGSVVLPVLGAVPDGASRDSVPQPRDRSSSRRACARRLLS